MKSLVVGRLVSECRHCDGNQESRWQSQTAFAGTYPPFVEETVLNEAVIVMSRAPKHPDIPP